MIQVVSILVYDTSIDHGPPAQQSQELIPPISILSVPGPTSCAGERGQLIVMYDFNPAILWAIVVEFGKAVTISQSAENKHVCIWSWKILIQS